MLDTNDTTRIVLDGPLADVFVRKMHDVRVEASYLPPVVTTDEPGSSGRAIEVTGRGRTGTYSRPERCFGAQQTKHPSLMAWLSTSAGHFSRAFVLSLAATQINLTRLSSRGQTTGAFDPTVIALLFAEKKDIVVSVSPDLVKSREGVFASSLFSPSGAYLTWVAMFEDR